MFDPAHLVQSGGLFRIQGDRKSSEVVEQLVLPASPDDRAGDPVSILELAKSDLGGGRPDLLADLVGGG